MELLIVIVVIAVLATISVVAYAGITARAKDSAMETNVGNLIKKTGAISADSGTVDASLLIGTPTGSISPSHLQLLSENGLSIDALRHPRAGPREVTSVHFNGLYEGTHLLDLPDDTAVRQVAMPDEMPGGYTNWDDVLRDVEDLFNSPDSSYVQWNSTVHAATEQWEAANNRHEGVPTAEEEEALIRGFYNFIATTITVQHPAPDEEGRELAEAYAAYLVWAVHAMYGDDEVCITIPKKNMYIIELLGTSPTSDDSCFRQWDIPMQGSAMAVSCGQDMRTMTPLPNEVTGVRINYYSEVQKKWLSKSYGSGVPFMNYDEGLMWGWG